MSTWAWLRARLVGADLLVHSEVGPATDHASAHAFVAAELEHTAGAEQLAATWRAGARDDTVFAGTSECMVLWAAISVLDDQTPVEAASSWLADWAVALRAQGIEATIARPRVQN